MSYDELLKAEHEAYLKAVSEVDREIETAKEEIQRLQSRIQVISASKEGAVKAFDAALADLGKRRLAGEFDADIKAALPAKKKPRAGNETESEVLMAVSYFQPSPLDFTVGDAIDACEKMGMLIIRSTLTGILARLVKKEKLVVVEPGYRRRPTRYAVAELELEKTEEETGDQILADLIRADQEQEAENAK